MTITPLHKPSEGVLRVAGLMSGSGTNLIKILEHEGILSKEQGGSPYEVVVVFSDTWKSRAVEIGGRFDIPVVTRDIHSFYERRGRPRTDLLLRKEFDAETVKALGPYQIKVAAFAGYMSIATSPLINSFIGVNVHPADLSIEVEGKRRFTGDHAVRDAILAGEKTLRSTTHIVEEAVDYGRLLMVSPPMPVNIPAGIDLEDAGQLNEVVDQNQKHLKEKGDWVIFPRTLQYMAEGRYGFDKDGNLYLDERPIPKGLRLGDDAEYEYRIKDTRHKKPVC